MLPLAAPIARGAAGASELWDFNPTFGWRT
jgi:hypothetical protein